MVDDQTKTKQALKEELTAVRRELDAAEREIAQLKDAQAERQRVGKASRASEERCRKIVQLAPDGIVTANLKGVVTWCNPAFLELTGYTRDEIVGKHLSKLPTLRMDDIPRYMKLLSSLLRGRSPKPFEFRWVHKDGATRWGEAHIGVTKKGSRIIGLQAILRDVTERKQTEEALRESEVKFRTLVDQAPEALFLHAMDGQIVDVNQAAVERYGYTREQLLDMEASDIDPDYVERENSGAFWKQLDKKGQIRFEGRHRCSDGTILSVAVSLSVIELAGVKHILALAEDITERKQAQEALRESEERFRDLVEHSFDLICTHDLEGKLLSVNPATERITGYSADELVGMNVRDILAPEVRDQFKDYLAEIASTGEASGLMQVVNRSGERVIWEYHNSLRVEGVPAPIVRGTARDITERRRAEKELRQQERLATVGQLAAGIAHDFRNLLGTIILYAQMDLNAPDTPPGLANHLRIIIEESRKATDLIQQILDFSSRAMIKRQPLDMADFLGQTLKVLRRTIPESVRMSLRVEPGPGQEGDAHTVLADPGRLQQALTNLALNAHDAMPEGGDLRLVLSRLELAANEAPPVAEMKPGAWVRLDVSDTGEGMTEEVQEHLFEPFFTTKEVDKGTGLGLAQVYGIIRQHEGAIDVETAPGEGTTFTIYLPVEDIEPEAEDTDGGDASSGWRARGETLLLVEDNRALREAAERILASLGYQVLTAADGRQAVDVYQAAGGADLIITDLVMPNMGGEALMRTLTTRRGGPDAGYEVPGVGITGYAVEDVTAELREVGFVDLIQKPFNADDLARVIRCALDEGQGR